MSDAGTFRRCALTRAWVLVAPERAGVEPVSDDFSGLPELVAPCPFCAGNEGATEPSLEAYPAVGAWRVRSIPNKFPAVRIGADGPRSELRRPATGLQEVVVETPDHDADLADYEAARAAEVLAFYRSRLRALEQTPNTSQVCLFRNRGRRAGSSQPHPHGQLLTLAVPGPEQEARWAAAVDAQRATGRTLLSGVVEREVQHGARVVDETAGFVVACLAAPRTNWQLAVFPRAGAGSFSAAEDALLEELAVVLPRAIRRALGASGKTDYNVIWRLPPPAERDGPAASWHIEILPRGGAGAGFELSSGMPLIAVAPELAAERMRAQKLRP